MRLPDETPSELSEEARVWDLLASWDVHPGNARLERHAMYTFRARYAQRWRAGHVLLAGDAAHLMPPFAGQGLCAGIRDVANLAWKLDLVLRNRASQALLDSYEQERLPSARAAIEFSIELGKVICVLDPAEAAARDEAMSAAFGPEPVEAAALPGIETGIIHASSPGAGHLFVQGAVDGRLFDDVHGAGWWLVSLKPAAASINPDSRAWFESIGGKLIGLDPCDEVCRSWFEAHSAAYALQRPDFHLYGAAADATAASRLVEDLRTDLHKVGQPEGA
jgi:FAD binding domain